MSDARPVPSEELHAQIYFVRGQSVMLDADLARIYGVTTKRLNEQLKRNKNRFPEDFAFRITGKELANMRSQSVTASLDHGGRRNFPYVFTEHGAIMQIEGRLDGHDETLAELFAAIRQLIEAPDEEGAPRREIGFHVKNARNSRQISLLDK